MRPALNSATRSHTLCTRSSRCEDISTATPSCLSERIISSSSAVACGSRPEVGSSRIAIDDVLHQDFGKAEPLAHAAREGADALVADVGEADAVERRGDPLVARRRLDADQRRGVAQIVERRHVVVEADGVGQIADHALDLERLARRIVAQHADAAGR